MNEVALGAAECFGAMGVMRDMPLQKYVHDSFIFLHSADNDSATKLKIAEAVAGYERRSPHRKTLRCFLLRSYAAPQGIKITA